MVEYDRTGLHKYSWKEKAKIREVTLFRDRHQVTTTSSAIPYSLWHHRIQMHHSTKMYLGMYVTCQQFKAAVDCSLSSLSHAGDIYLHGSTPIGGHFTRN